MRIHFLAGTLIAMTCSTSALACRVPPSPQRTLEQLYEADRIDAIAVATVTATATDEEAEAGQDGNLREAFVRFELKEGDASGNIRFIPWGEKIEELRRQGGIIVHGCGSLRLPNVNIGDSIVIYLGRGEESAQSVLLTLTLLDAVLVDKRIRLVWDNPSPVEANPQDKGD